MGRLKFYHVSILRYLVNLRCYYYFTSFVVRVNVRIIVQFTALRANVCITKKIAQTTKRLLNTRFTYMQHFFVEE